MSTGWRWGGALTVVALLAAAGLWMRERRGLLRFPVLAAPLSEAAYGRLAARPGWQARALEVAPGVTLRGLLRPPGRAGAPCVLYFSGNADAQLAQGQGFLEALGAGTDWGLAVFAYRGYDGSGGRPTREALLGDGARVLRALARGEWRSAGGVHVVGFSLGTGVASAAAVEEAPASLTLLAPFTELALVRPSAWARLSPGERFDTRPAVARVRGPVLVVHGTADDSLPVWMGRAVRDALGTRARYLERPDVGHVALLADAVALGAVRDFIASQGAGAFVRDGAR